MQVLNNDRQEEILREMNEVQKDVFIFCTTSKEEMGFLRDQMSIFRSKTEEFSKTLKYFVSNFQSKATILLNDQAKVFSERKANYKEALRFVFERYIWHFQNVQQEFDNLVSRSLFDFTKEFPSYLNDTLPKLTHENYQFKKHLNFAENAKSKLKDKKEAFIQTATSLKKEKMYSLRKGSEADEKDFQKIASKEDAYLKCFLSSSQEFLRATKNFESIFALYESCIKEKFALIYSQPFEKIDSGSAVPEEVEPIREKVLDFRVRFKNLRTQIYVENFRLNFENYLPFRKVVDYRSKLEQPSSSALRGKIDRLQSSLKDRQASEAVNLFIKSIAFDLSLEADMKDEIQNLLGIIEDHILLILCRLKIILKCEIEKFYLNSFPFNLLTSLVTNFFSKMTVAEEMDSTIIEISNLWFYIGSRTFLKSEADPERATIETSALFCCNDILIFMTTNFWNAFFQFFIAKFENKDTSVKVRLSLAIEKVLFLHSFITNNLEKSLRLASSLTGEFSANTKLISKNVKSKLAERLNLRPYRFKKRMKKLESAEKLKQVLILTIAKRFVDVKDLAALSILSRELRVPIIFRFLANSGLEEGISNETRKKIWLALFNLSRNQPEVNEQRNSLSPAQREQVHIDVLRTKAEYGEEYQTELEDILVSFLEDSSVGREYFQGLNYITSLLFDFLEDKEQTRRGLEFLAKNMIRDFLNSSLCEKVNLLNFQLNSLIEEHFPALWFRWKEADLRSEVLFSSFLISLFTCFVLRDWEFILDFWDLILLEEWVGVCKCILFIVHINLEKLMKMNPDETLRYFSEMKFEEAKVKMILQHSVKKFASRIVIDLSHFAELETNFRELI